MKQLIKAIVPQALWTQMRMLRLNYRRVSYRRRRVRHTYGGHELELELIDPMGADWYDHDWPELPEIAFLKHQRLQRGARVFDIGAHQCVVAMMLAKTVGPEGAVVAVEANPDNCAAGERNRTLNGIENLRILHAAGAARSGPVIFNRGPNGQVDDGSGAWGRMEVQGVSVDDLAAVHGVPDLLFIDVEGFECALLQGARKTLASGPDCFVEAHVGVGLETYGGSVEQILSLFPAGYEFFVAPPEGAFVPITKDTAVVRQRFFLVATQSKRSLALGDRDAIPEIAAPKDGQ
jgi:FkbM family methyltransferase